LLSLSVIFAAWKVLSRCWTGDTTVAIDNIDKAASCPMPLFIQTPKILFDFFAPAPLNNTAIGPLQSNLNI
jgi:hypothetical protein